MDTHEKTLTDFRTLLDRYGEVVARADGRWDAPSPCPDWQARDVLDHVVDSQRDFLARHDLPLGARPEGQPDQVWSAHARAATTALGGPDVLATAFDSAFGPSTVGATLATFFNLDLVIHRWDLAAALGTGTAFSEREIDLAEAALDTIGDAIRSPGACGPAVDLPDGATRQEQLIARTGRDPRAWPASQA